MDVCLSRGDSYFEFCPNAVVVTVVASAGI